MKLGLELRLKQTLAPQLIQSLKMLQMPLLKLEQTLRTELSANPMLEEIETLEQETEEKDDDTLEDIKTDDDEPQIDPRLKEIDWDTYLNDDHDYKMENRLLEPKTEVFDQTSAAQKTLSDYLMEQLRLLKLTDQERVIGEYIIGNVDTRGFLVVSIADMATELEVEPEKIESALKQLQTMDPAGLCSRDLREFLLIQLEEKDLKSTLAYRIVDEHLYELDKKSVLQLSKAMNVPFEKAQDAMDLIRTLSPEPGRGLFDSRAMPVTPDMVIERVGDDYVVYHNDKSLPRMRINPNYRSLLKRKSSTGEDTKKYVREKLEQARWLLNAVNQRRGTMLRVMEAIVGEQREFFEKGSSFLRPLIMEDIAQIVNMNVATVSRVANGKYVQTPHGVFEIKYFFNSGITRQDGSEMTKRNVKKRLEEIIAAEDTTQPLSDQEIYRQLNEEGIKLARRTVTKYREELKILPARFRKRAE